LWFRERLSAMEFMGMLGVFGGIVAILTSR
jgi:hypothetical protein